MTHPLRVLFVEDCEDDVMLVLRSLKKGGLDAAYQRVDRADSLTAALKNETWDIVISDYSMPSFSGRDALQLVHRYSPNIPFILVSGALGEDKAVEIMREGAHDYIMKSNLKRLALAVKRELSDASARREKNLAETELRRNIAKLRRTLEQTVGALASALEQRDPYTAGHQQRVARLACAIAREMGVPGSQIAGIRVSAMIHDIGKIHVPAEILSKPGRLDDLEMQLINTHSQVGFDILKAIEFPWPVAQTVYQHHERVDGSGKPLGLNGDDIITEARIVSVADVVEAMSSHRPYRPSLGVEKALEEIEQHRDSYYDIGAVDACVRLYEEKRFSFENCDFVAGGNGDE